MGGGFALGAKLARPSAEVWLLWGDGSAAYSLAELDSFARHGLGVIAVVGNDAGWTQIAREQVEILGDDCGTVLRHNDYHVVAEGYGGLGLLIERPEEIDGTLARAKAEAAKGRPVLVNVLLGTNGTPVPTSVFSSGTTRYLEIQVDGELLLPRQRLGSVGWAMEADHAASAGSASARSRLRRFR